jgi:hypothetical protein
MALQVNPYQLNRKETDLAIFFPYPWGGERHNNEQLLKEISLLTGALVIGAQTPGTGRIYIDRATRRGLKPAGVEALAADYAGEVNAYLESEGRPRRLLAAQSGRVLLGALMQLSEHRPFTEVVLRDGTNLCAPETVRHGIERLLSQPGEGEHTPYGLGPKNTMHKLRDVRARWHGRVEMLTQARLQCSTKGAQAVTALARDATTPLYHVTFEHGICGTPEQQAEFNKLLTASRLAWLTREDAADTLGAYTSIAVEVAKGNHADLQNPLILHDHINTVLNLTDLQIPRDKV